MSEIIIDFLSSFFRLFGAQIEKYEVIENKIVGTIDWVGEEDKQDFIMVFTNNESQWMNARLLCDYLHNNNIVKIDSIVISERELISQLVISGWNDESAQKSIDFLSSLEVKMLDDGEATDSFFLHF